MSGSQPIAAVRFNRRWQSYFPGDVAAFPLEMARGLVANRVADGMPPPVPSGTTDDGKPPPPARTPGSTVRK